MRFETWHILVLVTLVSAALGCSRSADSARGSPGEPAAQAIEAKTLSRTFSIVAMDPESGVCGAAVASKYPAVGAAVPFVRGGVGAFCTQHAHVPSWGPRALALLAEGRRPADILD